MPFTSFNLPDGQEAERKQFKTFVKVGAIWEVVGHGVEDSAVEYNVDSSTSTDILGVTRTKVNSTQPSQSFEPHTIRGGSALAFVLWDITRRNAVSELSNFEVMQVHEFVGVESEYAAEVHKNCTITPTSIGGSAYVDMPITINYSNDKTLGSASYGADGTPTFTAE